MLTLSACCVIGSSTISEPYFSISQFQVNLGSVLIYDDFNYPLPITWVQDPDTYSRRYTANVGDGFVAFYPSSYSNGSYQDMTIELEFCPYDDPYDCYSLGSSYTNAPYCTNLDYDTQLCTYYFNLNNTPNSNIGLIPRGTVSIAQQETYVASTSYCYDE